MITPLIYQPSSAQMQQVIDTQSLASYTYELVGMTAGTSAQGYVRITIGCKWEAVGWCLKSQL